MAFLLMLLKEVLVSEQHEMYTEHYQTIARSIIFADQI